MVASQVHLVRHGEVFNPAGVLYGRLPGYGLSALGIRMAQAAADDLRSRKRAVSALFASPLQRAQESAAPIAAAFGLPVQNEDRIIEPTNHFEGTVMRQALRSPANWPYMINPWRPSWGEPYRLIAQRMSDALQAAFDCVDDGDVVLVSHQLPIWVAHLALSGDRYLHDPRQRRCSLSSVTTLERRDGRIVEIGYAEPAAALYAGATDVGAV